MKATLFSLILAALLWIIPLEGDLRTLNPLLLFGFPAVLLLVIPFIWSASWSALQKGEQNITPRLIEMFVQDKKIHYKALAIVLLAPLTFVFALLLQYAPDIHPKIILSLWLVLLGVALDFTLSFLVRLTSYLNPFKASELFTLKAKENIRANRLDLVVDSLDALSEVSLRALERSNTALATQGIVEIREVGDNFLKAAKSFANLTQDLDKQQNSGDKVSYTLFYLLSRLEMIGQKATQKKLEPVESQVLTAIGRVAISSAKYDLSLTSYPLLALGRSASEATEAGLKEAGIKGEIVLIEVAKSILRDIDVSYSDLKTPFLTLIDNLDMVVKQLFKLDKSASIKTLIQPFKDLRELLKEPKVAGHQDIPVLLTELDRVEAEYAALESVMIALPPMPNLE